MHHEDAHDPPARSFQVHRRARLLRQLESLLANQQDHCPDLDLRLFLHQSFSPLLSFVDIPLLLQTLSILLVQKPSLLQPTTGQIETTADLNGEPSAAFFIAKQLDYALLRVESRQIVEIRPTAKSLIEQWQTSGRVGLQWKRLISRFVHGLGSSNLPHTLMD